MSGVERQLASPSTPAFAPTALLWCIRTRKYLDDLGRSDELLVDDLAADLVAFVSETMPGSIMRGLPRSEWHGTGKPDDAIRALADANTARRFERVVSKLGAVGSIPRDGWRLGGDALYQGSILKAPAVLQAFANRAGGDVILAVPDRTLVLAIPQSTEGLRSFRHRVNQAFREAMAPCSDALLITDGATVRALEVTPSHRRSGGFMEWLRD